MKLKFVISICVAMFGLPVLSNTPDGSIRPVARPAPETAPKPTADIRPMLRPLSPQEIYARDNPVTAALGPTTSLYPVIRNEEVVQQALFKKRKERRARKKGAVCGDLDIQGTFVGRVPGNGACGIKDAVKIKSISGVKLSQQALVNCTTAKALKKWIDSGMKPAMKSHGGVSEIRVAAHYACRTRNNRKGAKLSEHAKGNAIDISGFRMSNGETITVLKGWRSGKTSKALKKMHKAACGPFGTVLGPNADRYHQDHFHFDVARHRGGSYCR